jgi:hypothetical protein
MIDITDIIENVIYSLEKKGIRASITTMYERGKNTPMIVMENVVATKNGETLTFWTEDALRQIGKEK